MVTLELETINDELQLVVTGDTLDDLQPFLELADKVGANVFIEPVTNERTQQARALTFYLYQFEDVDVLVVFLLTCRYLAEGQHGAEKMRALGNDANEQARKILGVTP